MNAKHFKSETDKGVRVRIMFDAIKGFSATRTRVVAGLARTLGIGTILCGAGVMASCHSNLIDGRTPVYPVIDDGGIRSPVPGSRILSLLMGGAPVGVAPEIAS